MRNEIPFVKVVEFYPKRSSQDGRRLLGSLHVRLPGLGIDIRGILVKRNNNHWFFGMPYSWGLDKDNKKIKFPAFAFSDRGMNDSVKNEIYAKGKEFIERKMKISAN